MNAPQDWITTLGLIAATLASGVAMVGAIRRVTSSPEGSEPRRVGPVIPGVRLAVLLVAVICGGLFLYRALVLHAGWVPIDSHVDGLVLLSAILALVIVYLQWTGRLAGVGMFALPVLTLMTLWGVCASWWTLRPFDIGSVWRIVHLVSVYLGTLCIIAAAAAGALWLYVDRQMRSRDHRGERLKRLGRLADLESIESAITSAATAGFILLTVALATGLVIVTADETRLGDGWWYSPKVILAAAAWAIFALVMNVRYVATFRGRRAAVLSIVGLALLIAVLGISQAIDSPVPTGPAGTQGPSGASESRQGWHGQRVRPKAEKSTVRLRGAAPRSTVDSGSSLASADRATPRALSLCLPEVL